MSSLRAKEPRTQRRSGRAASSTPALEPPAEDNQQVSAVTRALEVLGAFRPGESPLGNSEIAERTGLPKPTVSRLTYTLALEGYLDFDPRHRTYELGGAAVALGAVALSRRNVRTLALPLMRSLADESAFNVGLGTRDRQKMIYTEACEGSGLINLRLYAGSHLPIMTSAMGRAYLAAHEPDARNEIVQKLRPLYGSEWSMVLKGVEEAVQELHDFGYCTSLGDWQKDIHGVAVPIRLPEGGRVFAVNLGGAAFMLSQRLIRDDLGPKLVELARNVEASIRPALGKT